MNFRNYLQGDEVSIHILEDSDTISFDRKYANPGIKTNMERKSLDKETRILKQITLVQTIQYVDNLNICVVFWCRKLETLKNYRIYPKYADRQTV